MAFELYVNANLKTYFFFEACERIRQFRNSNKPCHVVSAITGFQQPDDMQFVEK